MRRQVKKVTSKVSDPTKSIKVQLDPRTIVTVRNMSGVELWQSRYPGARIIQ